MCIVISRFSFGIALFSTSICLAQITTDGSVGPRQMLTGADMQIGAELGSTRGTNLFHSFQTFDIPAGRSATFTGPDKIQNVISRVTSGKISNIDGQLRSKVGTADVYLINPSGVVMGANASVDVPAALHLSTADEVRFSDGSRYSARDPASSSLTIAAPESFGFLSPQPATLTVNGSQLSVKAGKHMTLSGGDVTITGSVDKPAKMTAPGGTIRVEAVGKTGKSVAINKPSVTPGSGQLTVKHARIETSGDGGGLIAIRAGSSALENAQLITENQSKTDAIGGIDVAIAGALQLNQSWLFADTVAPGKGGSVKVRAGELRMNAALIFSDSYRHAALPSADAIGNAGGVAVAVTGSLNLDNGSAIQSVAWAEGNAGAINLTVDGLLALRQGAQISGSTWATGAAGTVTVQAGAMRLDNEGSAEQFTGIWSDANVGSTGNAGAINLTSAGLLEVVNGAVISSNTWAAGAAGTVTVQAGALRVDGGLTGQVTEIASNVKSSSTGSAGAVNLSVDGLLEVLNGADISSRTSAGAAGAVTVRTGALRLDGGGLTEQMTGIDSTAYPNSTGNAGAVTLNIDGLLEVRNGAVISSSTFAMGDAGMLTIQAGELRLDSQGFTHWFTGITSAAYQTGLSGNAGAIHLTVAGLLEMLNGAVISSDTFAMGNAGAVTIQAGALRLDDRGLADQVTKIASDAKPNATGHAGDVTLTVVGLLEILNGAQILSNTFATGNAGKIMVQANELHLDDGGFADQFTGIASNANENSSGHAGAIILTVVDLLEMRNGAIISSDTWATGNAGSVTVQTGRLRLDGGLSEQFTAIASDANAGSIGNAGDVTLTVNGLLEMRNGAEISSSTSATGNAGTMTVQAGEVFLDNAGIYSQANKHSSGNAGAVNLTVAGALEVLNRAKVSTSTWGGGHAGDVFITANAAELNGGGITEPLTTIYSDAYSTSTGNAGTVTLNIDGLLEVRNAAAISTNAWAIGDAGTVTVKAGDLLLDGANSLISSRALESARGRVGNLNIAANTVMLTDGAQISIAALQTVADPTLPLDRRIQINAESLALNASTITAQSTGNVPAAAIQINAADLHLNAASRITTESLAANAGAITIDGDILWLRDSQITTSAEGQNGDGGDITLTPHNLILQSGFIQANTAASGARGGDIRINSDTLIASQRLLTVGGNERQTFTAGNNRNIIQAAAPGGEQGNINILALNLDISASVVPPSAPFGDLDDLFADICQTLNGPLASSLIDRGNGGVPVDSSAPVAVSLGGIRLDRILNHTTE
ncbi:hypothetical protein CKO12_12970 [Chromatium okenii]|uniref:two-partner secretion domain-containing protein n=1 Tax=Chromatium okenii TaxID=61644 RepID=UPI00190430B3|nr:filamentous hemagglutinin N-terminal domain-containing protein [Chromatium okenii]MBK1642764.1 hypothetical protein [Chromatium okenii]